MHIATRLLSTQVDKNQFYVEPELTERLHDSIMILLSNYLKKLPYTCVLHMHSIRNNSTMVFPFTYLIKRVDTLD